MLPRLAVQIVNYRTADHLARCLETLSGDLEASGLAASVHVLDNASGEDVKPLVAPFPGWRAHRARRNLGFGGGHNLLCTLHDAPYLLLLNPDIEIVQPATVKRLLEALLARPEARVVGPRLIDAAGAPQRWDHGRLHGVRAQISLRGGHSYWQATDLPQEVAWVAGTAMLVERAAFERVHGFDERFFLYKEDEDLCRRVRQDGGTVRYEPGISVRHLGSVVAGRGAELARAERQFIDKHFAGRRSQRVFEWIHRTLPRVRL